MNARRSAAVSSLALVCGLVLGCTGFYEIPIETPIQPKMDVSPFQRVLVVGFISGGTEDVDANQETVRLLRSQLRTKSPLRVIEAEVLPLAAVAEDQLKDVSMPASAAVDGPIPVPQIPAADVPAKAADAKAGTEPKVRNEKDLEKYNKIFADTAYWKKLGEEYQNPLIVTGTILFTPNSTSGFITRQQEIYDSFGRRQVVPVRMYQERKGYVLQPKFIFIDGRTGATIYSETFREERLYPAQQTVPALSSYFELMDQIMPSFLSTLSAQKIRGTRVLLK
jgi:hypothetical protein